MFKTGNPVTGKDFIDRKKHLPLFKTYIDNNHNIMIKAPRRFGKTSIVKHLLENKQEYNYIYIDINIVSNLKSLGDKILDSAYSLSNIDNFVYKAKNSIVELFKSTDNMSLDIKELFNISVEFNNSNDNIDEIKYYLHSLDVLDKIAVKKGINIKCVFDEFQDILKIANKEILNKTRSIIQHHKNITYIFLGSIETIMTEIFENKSSAFFHFAKIIDLPPLDNQELLSYSKSVLNKEGIECVHLEKYLDFLGGHPDYSMQFLQKVYITSLAYRYTKIDDKQMNEFMLDTIVDNTAYINELINKAKTKKHHLEVLVAISKDVKVSIDGKTLYNVRVSLEDMGLIRKIAQGKYVLVDVFLKFVLKIGGFAQIGGDSKALLK